MKKFSLDRRLITGLICALAGAAVTMAAIILGFGGVDGFVQAAKFASVLRIVSTEFVGDYDLGEFTDAALDNAVASLDDDWSYYMDADSYADYQDYSANRYQGIGVTIIQDEQTGGFRIEALTKDGPAQRAGLQAGEIILSVDGVSVIGAAVDDLRSLIQADFGAEALITVQNEQGQVRQVSVSCEEIYTSPVSSELLDEHVGYVAITNFRAGAGAEAVAAVEQLLEQGADSFVFDVRSNPGGQVSEMVEILDYLLPEGDIFIRADKRGHEVVERSDEHCVELPMAVVVNGDSYSAAEFFAAALRDYQWASVVGEPTTGKARSQVTIPLWDGSAVHISKYSYLTPGRVDLYEAGGLTPDVEVWLSEEELLAYQTGWLEPADDPQVQAAVGALGA